MKGRETSNFQKWMLEFMECQTFPSPIAAVFYLFAKLIKIWIQIGIIEGESVG